MAESTPSIAKKTFEGGCHCGKIRYKAALSIPEPPEHPVATRCNCTICVKSGFTGIRLGSGDDLTLLSPSSLDEVPDYIYRNKDVHHYFCDKCGAQIYGTGVYEYEGKKFEFFSINLGSLDQPQEGLDLSKFEMKYWDGLGDNWAKGQSDKPFSGGAI